MGFHLPSPKSTITRSANGAKKREGNMSYNFVGLDNKSPNWYSGPFLVDLFLVLLSVHLVLLLLCWLVLRSNGACEEACSYHGSSRQGAAEPSDEQRRAVFLLRPERGGEGVAVRSRRRRSAPSRRLHKIPRLQSLHQEQESHICSGLSNPQV